MLRLLLLIGRVYKCLSSYFMVHPVLRAHVLFRPSSESPKRLISAWGKDHRVDTSHLYGRPRFPNVGNIASHIEDFQANLRHGSRLQPDAGGHIEDFPF